MSTAPGGGSSGVGVRGRGPPFKSAGVSPEPPGVPPERMGAGPAPPAGRGAPGSGGARQRGGTRRGRGVPGRRPPASTWLASGGEEDPKSAWKEGGESNPDGADGALVLNLETGPSRRKLQVIFPSAQPPPKNYLKGHLMPVSRADELNLIKQAPLCSQSWSVCFSGLYRTYFYCSAINFSIFWI